MQNPTEQQLIDATNLLCDYVSQHLRPGWNMTLTMNNEEAYLTLEDEDCVDHNDIESGPDVSGVTALIEYAREYDSQGE